MEPIGFYLKQVLAVVLSSSLLSATVPPPSPGTTGAPPVRLDKPIPALTARPALTKTTAAQSATLAIEPKLRSQLERDGMARGTKAAEFIVSDNQKAINTGRINGLAAKRQLAGATAALDAHGLSFIENKGQFDARVKFQVSNHGSTLWLTENGVVFDFLRNKPSAAVSSFSEMQSSNASTTIPRLDKGERMEQSALSDVERHVIYQEFVGVSKNFAIETKAAQEGTYNYLSGTDPSKWQTQVRRYSEIVYHDLWKGVDLRFYGKGSNLEQEFVVKPGADVSQVQVAYRGIERLQVEKDGSLLITTAAGEMRESRPGIYQEIAGSKVAVDGRFKPLTATSYTFEISGYDQKYAVVVDPTLLYSTYLGGSAGITPFGNCSDINVGVVCPLETAVGIAVDASGNAYVTGYTLSPDFPVTPGAFQTAQAAVAYTGFVTKLNPTGSGLVYSSYFNNTYYGPTGIAVDTAGNAYIAGVTSGPNNAAFPTTPNAYSQACQTAFNSSGTTSAFLSVLNPSGTGLVYSTCFGGVGTAGGPPGVTGLAIDSKGRAFIVGYTGSPGGVPTTPNAVQSSPINTSTYSFLTAFDTTASGPASLYYSTYLGTANPTGAGDAASGVAVDSFGKIYVTGTTATGFPVTPGAYQTVYPPCIPNGILCPASGASFVAKIDPTASGQQSLIYATYFGGMGSTTANAIAVDSSGAAYITGITSGSYYHSFPFTPGAFQTSVGADISASFVTKLNTAGSQLVYSTLLGNVSSGNSIVVDSLGDAHVAGNFRANIVFPTTTDAFQNTYTKLDSGSGEAFLTKLNPTGTGLIYSSYLGGEGHEVATGVAIDQTGDGYVVGHTSSATFPITPRVFQPTMNGTGDAFVTKFPLGTAFRVLQIVPSSGGNAGSFTATISGSGFHSGVAVKLSGGGPDIPANPVVIEPNGLSVAATFNLQGAVPGIRDVVVTNPDGTSLTLTQAFTVVAGGASNLQIFKTATRAVPGKLLTYAIAVVNTGNLDSGTVPIVESLEPWFTFVSSNPAPTAIRQAPKAFPPGANGTYNAFIEWDLPNISAASSTTLQYTVLLDPAFPAGQSVEGPACIEIGTDLCDASFYSCLVVAGAGCIAQPELCIEEINTCTLEHIGCHFLAGKICGIHTQPVRSSFDPNALTGLLGVGQAQWVSGLTPLTYAISFANESTATAPAQQVIVTNPVDPNSDLNTLQLTAINLIGIPVPISSTFAPVAGANEFVTNLDLRPSQKLLVNVDVKLDPTSRVLTWTFTSIDPTTGQPPLDPTIGFLPPGGDGNVFFKVSPIRTLPTASQVTDLATIVFDANQPMSTQPWTNTIDNTAPTSQVLSLPASENSVNFTVQWAGTDVGSGIQDFTIYVSDNGGPFTPFQTNTTATSATFMGQTGHTYGFYSIARDLVGNVEASKTIAEATTLAGSGIDNIPPITTVATSPQPNAAGWNTSNVTITLMAADNLGGSGVKQVSYSATGAQAIPATSVEGSSASLVISSEGTSTVTFFSTDNAGNVEVPNRLTIRLDKTPPAVNCGGPDGLWHASDVSIPCTASDTVSGLANAPDASFSLSTAVPAGTETSNAATGTRSVCDVAGNCATAGPVTGNMVDKKPPTINITSPTAGGSYLLNQAVNANYSCTDGGSGVATCSGTVASGSPINTAPVGAKTFLVDATDKVGNVASPQSVSYSVTYATCLLYNPTRAVQSGSTIPLKIQLCDANNADVSSSSIVVHGLSLVQTSTNASETLQSSGNANPDNDFRFDPTLGPTGGYIFNLSTKGLTTGSYQLTFTAGADPLPHVLSFQVR